MFLAGKTGLKKLLAGPPVEQAIADTAAAFQDIEPAPALEKWTGSSAFETFLAGIEEGRREVTDGDVAAFAAEGGLYIPEDSEAIARRILETFVLARAQAVTILNRINDSGH